MDKILTAVAVAVLVAACVNQAGAPKQSMGVDDTTDLTGAAIAVVCEECHGTKGSSNTQGIPDLAGQQAAYLVASTQKYIDGNRDQEAKMAMLNGLEQAEIELMARYFAAQSPSRRDAPPFGDPANGQLLSDACAGCHGKVGNSRRALTPSLAAQDPWYLVTAIRAYREQSRPHETMAIDISDREIEDIAAFYTTQTGRSSQ